MKRTLLSLLCFLSIKASYSQGIFYESFDYVNEVAGDELYEWKIINTSDPLGTDSDECWYQADMSMGINAHMGPEANSYIQADRFSTSATTGGTISAWLISPLLFASNGDSVRFHAISHSSDNRPDKIEVRISTLGAESVMPTSANDVGSFNILIGVINPDLTASGFPSVNNGDNWQLYRFLVAGFSFGEECRIAIRYIVNNAGAQGPNASAVGIDEFYLVGPEGYVGVEESKTAQAFKLYPNPTTDNFRIPVNLTDLQVIDLNNRVILNQNVMNAQAALNVSGLNSGIYIVKGKMEDGSIVHSRLIKQ